MHPEAADAEQPEASHRQPSSTATASPRPKKLLFVVNVDWFFISHRLPVAEAALRAGYEVHLACGSTGKHEELQAGGISVHPLPISRGAAGVFGELTTLASLVSLMRSLKPDIVHLVTIKPILLGGLAARFAKVPNVVAAISGLGSVFVARGIGARARRAVVALLYRIALGARNITAIFQNPHDARTVTAMAGLRPTQAEMIRGSGADLDRCLPSPLPAGEAVVVFAARLLGDKGVREFVAAAERLKTQGVAAQFILAGSFDPDNPSAITQGELDRWQAEGAVEIIGHCADIPALFAKSHMVVLPSFYGEGLPKVLMEAAACGRAVVTTDVPGCRDAVEPGRTALVVPPRSAEALAAAIEELINDRARCAEMGRAGRALAEREFSIDRVVAAHLAIYNRLAARAE